MISAAEAKFLSLYRILAARYLDCTIDAVPMPVEEYRFHSVRRWRADFAWPAAKVLVEIEGGQWTGGRHNRAAGYAKDCEKYNTATLEGWRVFRFTPQMLDTHLELVEAVVQLVVDARVGISTDMTFYHEL